MEQANGFCQDFSNKIQALLDRMVADGKCAGASIAVGRFDKLASRAGAGTLVPITGFANAVASPAIEAKSEGYIKGVAAQMFVIAGPVIVYGSASSVIYGIIYYISMKIAGQI